MDGKLAQLIEIEGYASLDDMLAEVASDASLPASVSARDVHTRVRWSRIKTPAGAKRAAGKASAPRSFSPASYRRPR